MRLLIWVCIVCLSGCVANAPFRSQSGHDCGGHLGGCGKDLEAYDNFNVAFFEYTERGNDLDPIRKKILLEKIQAQSHPHGLALVVFVHGWKHNASTGDDNVQSFKSALFRIAESKVIGGRKLIGVYVGWRGLSLKVPVLRQLTFWDRKATAEEVGRGGVTKLLLDLERISKENNKNFMLTVGHSFGAAITFSALHDVLLYKMVAAENGEPLVPFGNGVVLLNPALEANQGLLLKESSMRLGAAGKRMPSLMHVISSRADMPTNLAFPIGQFFGITMTWDQGFLERSYEEMLKLPGRKRMLMLSEREMDETTIGNYSPFFTGSIGDSEVGEGLSDLTLKNTTNSAGFSTEYTPFSLSKRLMPNPSSWDVWSLPGIQLGAGWRHDTYCSAEGWGAARFPCFKDDPIDFISVPKTFIANHNDVFNAKVVALLSAIVVQSYWQRVDRIDPPWFCRDSSDEFSFSNCFSAYLRYYECSS